MGVKGKLWCMEPVLRLSISDHIQLIYVYI